MHTWHDTVCDLAESADDALSSVAGNCAYAQSLHPEHETETLGNIQAALEQAERAARLATQARDRLRAELAILTRLNSRRLATLLRKTP